MLLLSQFIQCLYFTNILPLSFYFFCTLGRAYIFYLLIGTAKLTNSKRKNFFVFIVYLPYFCRRACFLHAISKKIIVKINLRFLCFFIHLKASYKNQPNTHLHCFTALQSRNNLLKFLLLNFLLNDLSDVVQRYNKT